MKSKYFQATSITSWILIFGLIKSVSSANILFYVVFFSYSHRLSMWPLVENLASAGHNVTFLSPYKNPNPDPRITEYNPKLYTEQLNTDWNDHFNLYDLRKNKEEFAQVWWPSLDLAVWGCETLYKDDEFVDWVRNSKFDLVIIDTDFNECAFGMAHFWKAKFMMYATYGALGWWHDQHGLPDETSSVTDTILGFPLEFGFWQRFANAMSPLVWKAVRDFYYFPKMEKVTKMGMEKVTGNKNFEAPSFSEFEKNISLILTTAHPAITYTRSYPPNIVEVGGVVVPDKPAPIPKNVENFIGKDDFIYISLGSITEFTLFPREAQEDFINTIKAFPTMKFIWKAAKKIEGHDLPGNILFLEWTPQVALLAHPNIKGFITHAGLGSTTQAIYFGVPLVLFPVFADQDMNAGFVESKGAGIKLEITDIDGKQFENAIKEILGNPKYPNAMKRLSSFFKDRPMSAQHTALWWTEFVLRHDNVNEFLTPPSVGQPWWVRRQLDVWFLALMIFVLIVTLPLLISYKVFKILFCSKQSKSIVTEQKKRI